jgi:hypothetical protein
MMDMLGRRVRAFASPVEEKYETGAKCADNQIQVLQVLARQFL